MAYFDSGSLTQSPVNVVFFPAFAYQCPGRWIPGSSAFHNSQVDRVVLPCENSQPWTFAPPLFPTLAARRFHSSQRITIRHPGSEVREVYSLFTRRHQTLGKDGCEGGEEGLGWGILKRTFISFIANLRGLWEFVSMQFTALDFPARTRNTTQEKY